MLLGCVGWEDPRLKEASDAAVSVENLVDLTVLTCAEFLVCLVEYNPGQVQNG